MLEWFRIRRKAKTGPRITAVRAILDFMPRAWVEECQHDPRTDYWDVHKIQTDGRTTLVGCYASPYLAKRVKESLEREWANG